MGLFGGLIKDSPATFAINAVRAQKGRMAKSKAKRRRRTVSTVETTEYEAGHEMVTSLGRYLVIASVLMPLGGLYLGALVLVGFGIGLLVLGEHLKKRD